MDALPTPADELFSNAAALWRRQTIQGVEGQLVCWSRRKPLTVHMGLYTEGDEVLGRIKELERLFIEAGHACQMTTEIQPLSGTELIRVKLIFSPRL